jgi:hypothetical protein
MGVAKQRNMLGFSANLLARTFHFAPQPLKKHTLSD